VSLTGQELPPVCFQRSHARELLALSPERGARRRRSAIHRFWLRRARRPRNSRSGQCGCALFRLGSVRSVAHDLATGPNTAADSARRPCATWLFAGCSSTTACSIGWRMWCGSMRSVIPIRKMVSARSRRERAEIRRSACALSAQSGPGSALRSAPRRTARHERRRRARYRGVLEHPDRWVRQKCPASVTSLRPR